MGGHRHARGFGKSEKNMEVRYLTCSTCFKNQKNPPVLATIDSNGIIRIKRYHKAATVIRGNDIIVTCDQCNESLVIQTGVDSQSVRDLNIVGTLMIQNNQYTHLWK